MEKNNKKNGKQSPELGASKDGMQKGGIIIQATDPFTSQTVEVKGTRRMLPNKSKKATWY
jgi:hypothetical protein|tara:strand:+ start:300 stop:479 length:180 start_codon:yes stop_codon:yes gene_type:complete